MENTLFTKLNWPKNTRMDLLAEVIPEDLLLKLLKLFRDRSEEERIVRFPKRQTILKCLAYYLGQRVERDELSWKEVMREWKGDYPTLKELGEKEKGMKTSRKELKNLHSQRKKEISKENG
jgi:hypothetical protein